MDFSALEDLGFYGRKFEPKYIWFKDNLINKTSARPATSSFSQHGLFALDMCFAKCVRDLKLDNYKLDTVAQFLKQGKKDDSFEFDYERMFEMWRNKDPGERLVVAEYCYVDVEILFNVFVALQVVQRNTQTAFVCKVALMHTCGGMQLKVWPVIREHAFGTCRMLMNWVPHVKTQKYKGAVVLEPEPVKKKKKQKPQKQKQKKNYTLFCY